MVSIVHSRITDSKAYPISISRNRVFQFSSSLASAAGVGGDSSSHSRRLALREREQLLVAHEIDQAERRQAGLARAEEIARAAQREIALGDLESRRWSRSSPSTGSRASSDNGD